MADTEKITLNMSVVDLGKIDLLVDQGFYASRSDLIRTAIREKLLAYDDQVREVVTRSSYGMGVMGFNRSDLEKWREQGVQKEINVVGLLVIAKDVTPELAVQTIKSLRVFGSLRASEAVKRALGDRIL